MTSEPLLRHKVPFIAIGCACLIALLAFGPRSAMGFFQLPILQDTGWDRTTFGLAMALQNLFWGLGQPLFGLVADKFGTWRVLALGAIFYLAGLVMMAHASSPEWLYIGGGLLVGLGIAACSFGVILAAIARLVAPEKRSFAFGLGTASGSAGMFLFAPISQASIDALGWSDSLMLLAAMMLLIPLLAIPLRGNSSTSSIAAVEFRQSTGEALREAFACKGYLLLTSGFFVCGFQVAFITAHFPAYISDLGIAARWAVIAAKQRPLVLQIPSANRFHFTLRLQGLECDGETTWTPAVAEVFYELAQNKYGEYRLERAGELQLRTNLDEHKRTFLQRKLSAFFGPVLDGGGVVIPDGGALGKVAELKVPEVIIDRNWIVFQVTGVEKLFLGR